MQLFLSVISGKAWPGSYRGMDGLIIATAQAADELGPLTQQELVAPLGDIWDLSTLRALWVSDDDVADLHRSQLLGYDAGFLQENGGVYSLIVHYLLNNRPGGQAGFTLNANLLFDNRSDALRLVEEWSRRQPDDAGDEETLGEGDTCRPMAIHLMQQILRDVA